MKRIGRIAAERIWGNLDLGAGHRLVAPAGIIGAFNTPGNVFFVDGIAGDNGNDGDNPASPWETIAYALSQCTNDHDDYIIILDCYQQDTFPVSINKSRVHIIGLDVENGKYPRMNASGDTAIFTLDADYCEIARLSLNAGASHGAIEWTGSHGRGAIRYCWFGETGAGLYGIYVPATFDAPEMLVEGCRFGAGLTSDGIRIAHNMTRGIIRECTFRPQGIGINVTNDMAVGWILDNRFLCASDANGQAITLAAASAGVFVDGNSAHIGNTIMTNNPYRDLGSNHWGNNYP